MNRIDHIGVFVRDIDATYSFITDVLGLEIERDIDNKEQSLRAIYFKCGNAQIEVMAFTTDEAREAWEAEKLSSWHIAIEVNDIEKVVEQLRAQGVTTTSANAGLTAWGTANYQTRPETSGGIQYQLTEYVGAPAPAE